MLPTIQLTLCLQRGNQAPRSKRDPHGRPKFWDSHFRDPRPTQKTRGRPIGPSGTQPSDRRPRRTAETRKSSAASSPSRNRPRDQRRTVAAAVIISNAAKRAIPISFTASATLTSRAPQKQEKSASDAICPITRCHANPATLMAYEPYHPGPHEPVTPSARTLSPRGTPRGPLDSSLRSE